MVAKYDRPAEVLRDWARPYMMSNPDVFAEFEDIADSVDAISEKVSDLVGFDLDEVKGAAAALSCPGIDDTLPSTVWRDEHTSHVKQLVALAEAFDALATELGEPAYAAHDLIDDRRKLLILAARRSHLFSDLLDVVLVGADGTKPDFAGYDKAIRDWAPKSAAWQAWVKTFVSGLVEYREAGKDARNAVASLMTRNELLQLENTGLGAEVNTLREELRELHKENERRKDTTAALRAELDTLKTTPAGHNADLQDQAITANTRANQYAYTIEQIRAVIAEHDKKRGA